MFKKIPLVQSNCNDVATIKRKKKRFYFYFYFCHSHKNIYNLVTRIVVFIIILAIIPKNSQLPVALAHSSFSCFSTIFHCCLS